MPRVDYTLERSEPSQGLWPVYGVLLLSLGSGLVVAVGVGLLALALRWPVKVVLVASGVVVLVVWLARLATVDQVGRKTEVITPVQDEARPTPPQVLTVEVFDPVRKHVALLDLPGGPDALAELAHGLLAGRTFSEADWTGQGRPFTRATFRDLRGQLLERGLLCWRRPGSPAQGVVLTTVGRHVFARLAETRAHAHASPGARFALTDGDLEGQGDA
jgi:hypothetical protein